MPKITYLCILFLLSISISYAENINVFEFTEKELLELKVSIDIKIGNLWSYKNHHYMSKYLIVLLQERCEKIQFKSGHPVCI